VTTQSRRSAAHTAGCRGVPVTASDADALVPGTHFTDLKSKDLKSRLEGAAQRLKLPTLRIPRVEPAVFLSDPGLRSRLDEVQSVRVYGRDDAAIGVPWIWRDLLASRPSASTSASRRRSPASCRT
jgi:hypothetical protein